MREAIDFLVLGALTALAVIIALTTTGCGDLEGGLDYTVVRTSSYGFRTYCAKEAETNCDRLRRVAELNDEVLDALLPRIVATGRLNFDQHDIEGEVKRIKVITWPADQIGALGLWSAPQGIILSDQRTPTMVRVFAHELVRFLLNEDGQAVAAQQSSNDWSGVTGELWQIAETTATEVLRNEHWIVDHATLVFGQSNAAHMPTDNLPGIVTSTAVDGTPMSCLHSTICWSGNLSDRTLTTAPIATQTTYVFLQGESDATRYDDALAYADNLRAMVAKVVAAQGAGQWFLSLPKRNVNHPFADIVRAATQQIGAEIGATVIDLEAYDGPADDAHLFPAEYERLEGDIAALVTL